MTAHISLLGLPGNTVDVRPYVNYGEGSYNFTSADYGVQFMRLISTTGEEKAARCVCISYNAWEKNLYSHAHWSL